MSPTACSGPGSGTLLLDLLTEDEEQLDLRSREFGFDIGLLARRLVGAIDWLATHFGGRPDLAGPALKGAMAPTLLIVGADPQVLALNRQAAAWFITYLRQMSVDPSVG